MNICDLIGLILIDLLIVVMYIFICVFLNVKYICMYMYNCDLKLEYKYIDFIVKKFKL